VLKSLGCVRSHDRKLAFGRFGGAAADRRVEIEDAVLLEAQRTAPGEIGRHGAAA